MEYISKKSCKLTLLLIVLTSLLTSNLQAHEGEEVDLPSGEKGILFIAMGPSNNFAMIDIATEKVMKAVAGQINPS